MAGNILYALNVKNNKINIKNSSDYWAFYPTDTHAYTFPLPACQPATWGRTETILIDCTISMGGAFT